MLERDLPWLQNVERARTPAHLPTVLSREEVAGVLSSRGFRAVAGSDESVRADAQRVQEALAADAERSKDRRKRLELALKRAQADLHALRQRLD